MNNLNNDFIKYLPSTIKELYLYNLNNINDECLNNFPTTLNYVEFFQPQIKKGSLKLFK